MQPQLGVLFTDDVSRILTEEARAAHARRILVKKIQPGARDGATLLPDVALSTPPSKADQAIAAVKDDLRRWAGRKVRTDMGEDQVEAIVADLRRLLDALDGYDGRNPQVNAARRELAAIRRLVEKEFDARTRPKVAPVTVRGYLDKSYPANPDAERGLAGRRFARNPIPPPQASIDREKAQGVKNPRGRTKGEQRLWYAQQEQALRDWYRNLPGPTGRPRKTKTSDN